MGGRLRRALGGAAAAGVAITSAVIVSSLSASGAEPPEATDPVYEPFGTLTINLTDDENSYSLTDPDGDPIVGPETILVDQPCATVLPGSGDLLVLAANPSSGTAGDTVQVRNRAFGVNTDGTSCGSSAAAVISDAEQLRLELGPILPDDVLIESGILQVTQNKKGNLAYSLDGSTPVPVAIGRDAQDTPQAVPIAAEFDGAGDVVIDDVSDLFTSITVESDSTKDNEGISIADGTTLNLVQLDPEFEVAVDCGEQVSATSAAGVATSVALVRGGNAAQDPDSNIVYSTTCTDVGGVVEIQSDDPLTAENEDRVFWNIGLVSVEDGTFQATTSTITIEWAPVPAGLAGQPTKIDYDAEGPGEYEDSQWCESFTETTNTDGDPVFDADFPAYSGPGNIDGKAPWCTFFRNDVIVGDQVFVVEKKVGQGDPWGQFA